MITLAWLPLGEMTKAGRAVEHPHTISTRLTETIQISKKEKQKGKTLRASSKIKQPEIACPYN
jgi:hypothetical protein